MFYEEEPPTAPGEPPSADVGPGVVQQDTGSGSGSTTTPAYPVAQTFKLHSRPGATKQIFLDFNGAEIKGTGWNTGSNPLGVGVYTGYDSDGHPATFSTAEDAWIQEVWRQVAETYAPFDVDVTTEDGGPDARERTTNLDTHFGTQVLFTNSTQAVAQLCNSTCLGLAWVGTFSDIDPAGFYQPAFIFTKTTMSPTVAAQGASHEAGHTLGLHHDGTTSQAYYAGTKAWGPVMGSAMPRAVTEFSKGEYAGANQTEDDLAVIQANGLPLRADDHGNTRQTADALGTKASYAVNGIISTRSDVDFFSIIAELLHQPDGGRNRNRSAISTRPETGCSQWLGGHRQELKPGLGLHHRQPARLDRHERVGDGAGGDRDLLPARRRRRERRPEEDRLVGLRQPRPVPPDRQGLRHQDLAVGSDVAQVTPAVVPADRHGNRGRQGRHVHSTGALAGADQQRRCGRHEVPRARPSAQRPGSHRPLLRLRLPQAGGAQPEHEAAEGALQVRRGGLQPGRRLAAVAVLQHRAGPLTDGQPPASRASALRTTAGSSVCHIGGRLARRKLP